MAISNEEIGIESVPYNFFKNDFIVVDKDDINEAFPASDGFQIMDIDDYLIISNSKDGGNKVYVLDRFRAEINPPDDFIQWAFANHIKLIDDKKLYLGSESQDVVREQMDYVMTLLSKKNKPSMLSVLKDAVSSIF